MPTTKNSHRLPTHIIPSRYKIMLKPDLEHFTFTGEEIISLAITKPTQEVTLHAVEIEIQKVELRCKEKIYSGKITFDQKKETATIRFSKKIPQGEASLLLVFSGILNDKMKGFYRSQYDVDGVSTHMAVTQFESTDARRAFPSFDEPSLKAIFDVTLMIPKDLTAISNTIEDSVTEHEAGYKVVQFAPTPKMSTYLLAFIIGKFEYVEGRSKEGVLIRVFVTPGKKKQANFALETAKKVLSFYNEYFQIAYPLPVLDLIAIPDFAAGAMENWGAVTFRETTLLVDEEHSSSANKQWVSLVIAHELAHMWFGNLVTMEWWTHLWLNEGFACFIEYLAVNEIYPEFDIWTQFLANEHNSALSLDGLKNTHPIEIPVKHPSEITEIFDEVSYAKGASIIKMLATYLGDADFRDGLRLYLKKHAYQNASTEHLWDAFSKVSKKDIRTLMRNWTQKPGYPVVSITEKQKTLQLSQKRFYINPEHAKTKDTTIWNIPLIIKTSETKKEEKIIYKTKKHEILKPKNDSWITINATEASFIRVAYPKKYIENFKKGINSGALSHLDKIGLIRDAFDLSQASVISTTEALILAKEYKNETDYTVWLELAGGIHTLASILYDQKEIFFAYKSFAKNIFENIAPKMGWNKMRNEKHTDALLRSLALYGAGTYGNMQIVTEAKTLFNNFMQGKHIDPDIRSVVYALSAENGGENEYEQLLSAYKKETLHQEKDRIARGLCSFTNPKILQKVLEWSITDAVRAQDAPRILYATFANPEGRDLAWDFLTKNWEYYSKKFAGSHGFSTVIEGASNFASKEKAKEVNTYFASHPVPELARTVKQVVEEISTNASWLERDKQAIKAFLASK